MTKKSPDEWFDEYGESHRNPTNKLVHWICVPAIVVSLVGIIWEIPVPGFMRNVPFLNWATVLILLSLVFYLRLSVPLAIGMLLFYAVIVAGVFAYKQAGFGPLWRSALLVFVVAWIGQFIGHKIEGRKPFFFKDLQFLLIGPAWLLGFLFRKLGIRY